MATILIVDDRPTNRQFLVTLLSYGGHRLLEAGDGEQALQLAIAERPDLVITDVVMPAMDGYEFARQIRSDARVAHTPLIFYTATYLEHEARELARGCGVEHVLIKPGEPEEILRVVAGVLALPPSSPALAPSTEFGSRHQRLLMDKLAAKVRELEDSIAERKLTEAALDKLLRAVEQTTDLVVVTDQEGVIEYVNPAFESITGYTRAEAIGKTPAIIKSGAYDREFYRSFWEQLLTGKTIQAEFTNRRQDGRLFYEEQTITPIKDADGNITHFVSTGKDVTERKQAEAELASTNTQLKNIFEGLDDVFFSYDVVNSRLLQVSPACQKVYGHPPQAFYANPLLWREVIHPDDQAAVAARELKNAAGQQTIDEHRILLPDGSSRWVQAKVNPTLDAAGRVIRLDGIVSDINERKQLEEQYRQAQKMEAIGQLTGGVAHDFNNLLTVILAFSDLLLRKSEAGSKEHKQLTEVRKAGERAAALIDQLLAFSRKQVLQPRVLDLNAVVADVEKMLRRVIGEDIDLLTVLEPALGKVEVDPSQIDQIIMNLAVNARDAMPTGGDLTVETANVELDETYARGHVGVRPGCYVMLSVSDSGCGMDSVTLNHIFEPFFTTKELGKGTGLGLATVYGIVKQSEGHIWVYSEPGKGTVFKIYLPRAERQAETRLADVWSAGQGGGTETILVVEDEPVLRDLVCDLLQEAGYKVLAARQGEEALDICRRHTSPVQLLITDVVMPRLGGRGLAERLAALSPQTQVLYMSGYTDDTIIRHGLLSSELAFLQKPFTEELLLRKVREVLDAPAP